MLKMPTKDYAHQIATNLAKLPKLSGRIVRLSAPTRSLRKTDLPIRHKDFVA
jgi:hypothetical protein